MDLYVRDLLGETRLCAASPTDTVASLGVSDNERVIIAGRTLGASDLIGEFESNSTAFISSGLDGGAKKRKKKTYTKPKKIKHKRKKVKLAVLKFYKVDSNDKVTKLRRDCPHEMCGPGVFMAMHFNRYYCGKCHLTYLIKKGDDN